MKTDEDTVDRGCTRDVGRASSRCWGRRQTRPVHGRGDGPLAPLGSASLRSWPLRYAVPSLNSARLFMWTTYGRLISCSMEGLPPQGRGVHPSCHALP